MKNIILIWVGVFIPGVSSNAQALRCQDGTLVLTGDKSIDVRVRCGEPAVREYGGIVKKGGRYINVERYLYIPSAGSFIRVLELHNGVVVKISTGRRAL